MGQPQVEDKKYTIQEWLDLEESTGERYEYHHGDIFKVTAMAGGSYNHGVISQSAFLELETRFRAKGRKCRAFTSEFKVEIEKEGRYVYPDTLAVCGEVQKSDNTKGSIVNPVLVIEVTSQSSESYDRFGKFNYYTSLPSLKQYMIASQDVPYVTLYNKNPKTELFEDNPIEVRGLDGVIDLSSVNVMLAMKDLYLDAEFDNTSAYLYPIK